MQTYTIGKSFYPEAKVPLKVYKERKEITEITPGTTYQIVIIEEGTGIINVNGSKLIISAPYLFMLNDEETIQIENARDIKLHMVLFHPNLLDNKFEFSFIKEASRLNVTDTQVQNLYLFNSFVIRDGSQSNHYKLTSIMLRRLLYLIDCIQMEIERQDTCYWICKGRSYLLELLCYLSRIPMMAIPVRDATLDCNVDQLEEILLYIHTYYSEKISLTTLVERFNTNRTTLNHMFKKYVGESLISYLIMLRIEAASLMLRDTGLPITEIAYRVGYEDNAYFNRSFKRVIGCTPSQYRKNNSWLLQLG